MNFIGAQILKSFCWIQKFPDQTDAPKLKNILKADIMGALIWGQCISHMFQLFMLTYIDRVRLK